MVALLIAATAVRAHRLADHNIWWDEGFAVAMARLPLLVMAVRTAADVHPPLHYLFLHYWDRLVGESEYAIRYSTLLFGLLDLALLYWLGRRYLGVAVGLVAVGLVAINRLHVEWSQEIRMYTIATALVLLSTGCFLRIFLEGDRRRRWWLLHLALSFVGLHTLYFFGLAPLIQSLVVVGALALRRVPPGLAARWIGLQVLALGSFVPWALLVLAQPRPTPPPIFPVDLFTWLRAVFTALPVGISAYLDDWTLVTVGATALLLLPLALGAARRRGWLLASLYGPLLVGPFVIHALSNPNPLFFSPNLFVRYMVVFLPHYALLVGLGLVVLARRSRPVAVALALGLVLVCAGTLLDLYGSRWARDEYRTIAGYVRGYAEPGDGVVLYSDWEWPVAEYYLGTDLPRYGVGTLVKQTPESARGLVDGWLGRHAGLWLVTLHDAYDADPEGYVRRELEGRARVAADFRVAERRLTLFTTDPNRSTSRPVATGPRHPATLDGQPSLLGFDRSEWEAAAGERVRLATYWRGPGPAEAGYRLELIGPDGVVRRRAADRLRADWPAAAWPTGATVRVEHEVRLDPRLSPGWYELRIGRRDGQVGAPVRLGRLLLRPAKERPTFLSGPPALPRREERFGGQIGLIGATVPTEAPRHGAQVPVQLLWQAVAAPERPYTAFAQVVGTATNPATGNAVWAQVDRPPDPARPTDDWLPGDWVLDERTLSLPSALPEGEYRLIVGLYDPTDGARLNVVGGGDHAVLAAWTIAGR
jgi:hypothetical protein